jgi:hypothetical protein
MSIHVPHSTRQRPVMALTALMCLLCTAPTNAALAQQPDPSPLWKAFPLTPDNAPGTPDKAPGAKPAKRPNNTLLRFFDTQDSRPAVNADGPDRSSAPVGVAIAFYVALGCLAAIGVGAATLHAVRRRTRAVTCEISWSPGEEGDAFLATAQLDGTEEVVVAESRRFERRSPEAPEYDEASREAYDQLLHDLYADGWLPYERGREWWEMRLRHEATSETSSPVRHG